MALLINHKNQIVIALSNKIYLLQLETSEFISTTILEDLPLSGKKIDSDSEQDDEKEMKNNKKVNKPETKIVEKMEVNNIAAFGDLLAVTTTEKSLLLYKIVDKTPKFVSRRRVNRKATALKFSPNGENIIVTDRTGDVYLFSCAVQENGQWLYGHMSQTLDILFSADQKHIITCDRDEKIRVTNYPDTHEIETFCLGHQEFVSAIEFLVPSLQYLVSVSGDETVRIWDYVNGKELHKIQLTKPGAGLKLKQVSENVFLFAVCLYDPPISAKIAIYKVELVADNTFKSTIVHEQQFQSLNLTSLEFHGDNCLAIAFVTASNRLALKFLKYNKDHKFVEDTAEQVSKTIDKLSSAGLADCQIEYVDHISKLYKKKFDNVSLYQERKKRRIEQQNNKD